MIFHLKNIQINVTYVMIKICLSYYLLLFTFVLYFIFLFSSYLTYALPAFWYSQTFILSCYTQYKNFYLFYFFYLYFYSFLVMYSLYLRMIPLISFYLKMTVWIYHFSLLFYCLSNIRNWNSDYDLFYLVKFINYCLSLISYHSYSCSY